MLTSGVLQDDGGEGEECAQQVGRLVGEGDPCTIRGGGRSGDWYVGGGVVVGVWVSGGWGWGATLYYYNSQYRRVVSISNRL